MFRAIVSEVMVGHILIPLRNEVEGVAFPNLFNIKIPQDIFTRLVLIYRVPYECDGRQTVAVYKI